MKKHSILFLLIGVILFLLTGCGASEGEESFTDSSPSGEQQAAASWDSTGNQMQLASFLIGDSLYYQEYERDEESGGTQVSVFRQDCANGNTELLTSVENGEILWYQVDQEGKLYLFYRTEGESVQFFLQCQADNGVTVYKQEIREAELGAEGASLEVIFHGAVNAAGQLCLAAFTGELYFFSQEGQYEGMAYAGWNNEAYQGSRCGLVNTGEQGIFSYQIAEAGEVLLRKVDFDKHSLGNAVSFTVGGQSGPGTAAVVQPVSYTSLEIFDGYEMGVLVSDSSGLWQYRPDDRETVLLFSWGDSRVNLKDYMIDAVGVLPEGAFYLVARLSHDDVSYVKVDYRDVQELPQKQTVTMGVLSMYMIMTEELEEMISRFNRQSESCQIELTFYDSIDDFNLELVKKQGPDLIYLYGMDSVMLEDKGVLEDLSPYFAASKIVKEDELLTSVRETGTINGKLVIVIPKYSVSGWLVEKGVTEGGGWTVDQFLSLAEANPQSLVFDQGEGVYKSLILNMALKADFDSYLSGPEGCSFDSPEFISLLQRIQKLPVPPRVYHDPLNPEYAEADWEYFSERGYLLKELHIGSLDIFYYSRFNGSLVDGTYAEVAGYPNKEGKPCYGLDVMFRFGINAASKQKDGAWEFLEYLLSAEYQDGMLTFPVRTDSLETYMKKNKLYYSELEITQQDRDFLREMIENAWADGGKSMAQTDIWRIIAEETAPLWAGDCSPEDAARKIQNRASLYLAE